MIMANEHDPRPQLVVIGNGMAGARVVEEICRRDASMFRITMIGDEPYGNYNRILLSDVLNGSKQPEEIFLNPLAWYEQNDIELIAGVRAATIDRDNRSIELADGRRVPFDKLIIATGSRPFVPPIPGVDLDGVFVFRTLDDCNAIASHAARANTAVVIGGGLLGLEAARGLMDHGPKVHIVEMAPHLMAVQLDDVGGSILGETIANLGIAAHCGRTTCSLLATEDGRVRGLAFDDGSELPCDMVVISAGIRANTGIARDAGLAVQRGIVVSDHLLTDDPDIYAVGECAQHDGTVYGLVAPIWEQCRVLADHITATDTANAYRGSLLATKLKVMGVHVASLGRRDAQDGDEVVCYQEPSRGVYQKLIISDDRLVGAILLGDTDLYNDLLSLLQSAKPVPRRRNELLFGAAAEQAVSLADLPDDHQVCDCNGVSKRQVVAAIEDGKCSVQAVAKCTRAGTGCGSCRTLVKGLIEAVAGEIRVDPSESWYVPAVPMDKPALVAEITGRGLKSVSAVLRELGTGEDEKSKMGLASLLRSIWNGEYEDERDSRFINDRVHANIQKDGRFSVVPRMYGGVTSADELIRLGQVAKRYDVPMVKITGGQRIDLLGVRKEDLPGIWRELDMPSGYAYTKAFRTCKTCVGTDFCRFGTNDSTGLGIAIEKRFQGIEFPAKVKMAVSGCPRNCAESTVKDVGIIASEGGEWEIVIGGAAGASVRKADVLCRADTQEEAIRITGRFLAYYRRHARYLERTYDFVPRIGLERLRAIIVDDIEAIGDELDQDIQASVDAYVDPWQSEALRPAYPAQFNGARSIALPVVG